MGGIENFLSTYTRDGSGSGSGSGYGDGFGDGSGDGDGFGDGFGSGSGDGFGSGSGDGSGSGYGDGYGDGFGSGSGDGSGSGYGLLSFNGRKIYYIDRIPSLIYSIRGNVARAAIVNSDLTLTQCYIAKSSNYFAHAESIEKAIQEARQKEISNLDVDSKIKLFQETFNSDEITAKDLFEWHGTLTGSCELGRKQFVKDRGIDIENDSFTLNEFMEICQGHYGSEIIKKLEI